MLPHNTRDKQESYHCSAQHYKEGSSQWKNAGKINKSHRYLKYLSLFTDDIIAYVENPEEPTGTE